jgi:hypothetical protein
MQLSGNLGIICTAAAVALVLGSNLVDISQVHEVFSKAKVQQQISLQGASRAESQLDALAKGTKALADAGNPNAKEILVVLRQNGVQINAGPPAAQQ